MWLMMKGTDNISPTVADQAATLVRTVNNSFGASLWTTPITPGMVISDQVTIVTQNPRELNAVFLFDEADPPFVEAKLEDFFNTTRTFTYPLDIPSVLSQTIDVIMPFMDITMLKDDFTPDDRLTEIEMTFNGQTHRRIVNDPNMGNGLVMAQFPFDIGALDTRTTTQVLTVTIDTADSIYTLGPRVCRPVFVENTAWLCSLEAGCISDTVQNVPGDFRLSGGIFLPIIMKP
jgi:hypothetical protein